MKRVLILLFEMLIAFIPSFVKSYRTKNRKRLDSIEVRLKRLEEKI